MIPLELDVCDPDSVRKAVETVADVAPGGLDILINNAGYALTGPAETLATDDVRAQFETNVIGLFDVTRAFLPQMRARRSGRIVNISSLLGAPRRATSRRRATRSSSGCSQRFPPD